MSRLYVGASFPFGHAIGWIMLTIFLVIGWSSHWDFSKLTWRSWILVVLGLYLIMR